jgi:hypothetical protein
VLEAVKKNGRLIKYASEELKNDKEVVLEALTRDGCSLFYVSKELQNNREVVLEAVKQDGRSLFFASKELQELRNCTCGCKAKWLFFEKLRNDKEVEWKSRGYFQWIKSIKKVDLNFKFSN